MEELGRLWRDAGVLRGSRDGVGTPRAREGAWDPREHPGKCPALAPMAPVASPGSCRGAWSRSPGPRFSAGECLLRTPRTTGRGSLHGEGGVRALWDPGRIPHSPFSQSSAQTSESISVSVQICRLGAGWGRLSQERLSAPRAGHRPETPRETGSQGVGPASPGPPHLARNRGRPLFPAPGPWFFPGTLPLAGWETGWQVGSTGTGSDLWVAGRAPSSTDTTPGTL